MVLEGLVGNLFFKAANGGLHSEIPGKPWWIDLRRISLVVAGFWEIVVCVHVHRFLWIRDLCCQNLGWLYIYIEREIYIYIYQMPIFVAVYIGLSENRVPSILTDYKFFSLFSFLGHTSFLYVNVFPSPTNYNIETLLCWCFSMFPLYQKLFIHQSPHIYVLYIYIYICIF